MTKKNVNILVVDDSMVMRKIIKRHLFAMGYANIFEASDGKKALEILKSNEIGLILSDWCMPGMHGIDLLRVVRADEDLKKIPFIMVTAEAQPHLVMEAIRAKVNQYVVKPFTQQALQANIEKVIGLYDS